MISCTRFSRRRFGTGIRSDARFSACRRRVSALDHATLQRYFEDAYVASNFVVVAVGNLDHDTVKSLVERAFAATRSAGSAIDDRPPVVVPAVQVRQKELEQSHVCLGTIGLPQNHPDRYAATR